MRSLFRVLPPALVATLITAMPIHAATIDGKLDAAYGPALVTQANQANGIGIDPISGSNNDCLGGELDEAYAYVDNNTLYLFLSGNTIFYWNIEGQTVWLPLDIFIDSRSGGQNTLLGNNPTLDFAYDMTMLQGLTFDAGFEADYWLSIGGNSGFTWPNLQAYYAELPTAGGGAGAYLGQTPCAGTGTLSGGTNPFGIMATIDESNTAGVTHGCGVSSGAGVTTGVEWAIPLAAIGNPSGCFRICAFLSSGNHSMLYNQVLGPLPPGNCGLGPASGVNFASIPGEQFFTVCPQPTPTHSSTWGRLKAIYR
jgi:hypothetical protein